jgi:pyruvate-formate lyase-activating enzyme
MTSISLHKVKKLELSQSKELTTDSGYTFECRHIVITDHNDNETKISLFAKECNEGMLKAKKIAF